MYMYIKAKKPVPTTSRNDFEEIKNIINIFFK